MLSMSATSEFPRRRIFQGRREKPKSSPKESSPRTMEYGAHEEVNHPRSIVAGYSNIEMSQTSQLSMDTYLRMNSQQSSHFTDVPLGQPSASMSYSSASSGGNPSSNFASCLGGAGMDSQRFLRGVIRNANSTSSSGGSRSSQSTRQGKKTRFAGIDDAATSKGSYNTSSSLSSRSGYRNQVQHPTTSRRGGSSFQSETQHQHQYEKGSNTVRQDSGHLRVLRSSDSCRQKQKFSPPTSMLDPFFSRIATPRQKLDIPYPPIQLQPRQRHQTERGCWSQRANAESAKEQSAGGADSLSGSGALNGTFDTYDGSRTSENYSSEPSTTDTKPLNSEEKSQRELSDARTEDMEAFQARLRQLLSDMECEAKAKFQKVSQSITYATESKLDEKAKAIKEVAQTITHDTESKLDEKAQAIKDVMNVELGQKANAIQEATQSNLQLQRSDAEKAIEHLIESKTTKLNEIASAIENLIESKTTKLKEIASTSMNKLLKLANKCNNSIANRLNSYLPASSKSDTNKDRNGNMIGGKVTAVQQSRRKHHPVVDSTDDDQLKQKPSTQFGSSPEKDNTQNFSSSTEGEMSLTQRSDSVSARTKDTVPAKPLRRSKRTRRWKEMKDCISTDKKIAPRANVTTPTNNKKQERKPTPTSSPRKKKPLPCPRSIPPLKVTNRNKALCVTPTAVNSQSLRQTKESAKKESTIKPKVPKPRFSKRRKRQNTDSLSTPKRLRTQCHSRLGGVPSEVVAFEDFHLSPLEGPNLLDFTKTKQRPNDFISGTPSTSKPPLLFGKKRRGKRTRNTAAQTYSKRRKKSFDVTDNDTFKFQAYDA